MRHFSAFTHSVLLATIPPFLAIPQYHLPYIQTQKAFHPSSLSERTLASLRESQQIIGSLQDRMTKDVAEDPPIHCKRPQPRPSLSYDEIMHFLEEIESDEFENKCTPEDLAQINQFVAICRNECSRLKFR